MAEQIDISQYRRTEYGLACTLNPSAIGHHDNGWTVKGEIKTDWYSWVNEFEAEHPAYGKVWGDFEEAVYATSTTAFEEFVKVFHPETWDYGDI